MRNGTAPHLQWHLRIMKEVSVEDVLPEEQRILTPPQASQTKIPVPRRVDPTSVGEKLWGFQVGDMKGYRKPRHLLKGTTHRLTCLQAIVLGSSGGTVTCGPSSLCGVLLLCNYQAGTIFPVLSHLPHGQI